MRPRRFAISEYGPPNTVISEMAAATQRPAAEIRALIYERGARIAATLGLSESPIVPLNYSITAEGIAGLLRVDRGVEVEVAPKFLGVGATGWAEDFFFLAMLSKHGHVLSKEGVSATRGTGDLITLLAHALVGMYWRLHRRPLKSYRHVRERSFFLDGEVDPFDLKWPGPDGFEQAIVQFTKANDVNSIIKLAANILAVRIRNYELRERLLGMAAHLGPQPPSPAGLDPPALPRRARAWQPLLDLSIDVISGIGAGLQPGDRRGPGFVVNTWRVWQDVLTLATRTHFGGASIHAERRSVLGSRFDQRGSRARDLVVRPDIYISNAEPGPFIVDAKYKGRVGRGDFRIGEADVYEALAFSRANGGCPVVLLYPRISDLAKLELGQLSPFEHVQIDGVQIVGADTEVRGIATRGGFPRFCARLGTDLKALVASFEAHRPSSDAPAMA